MKRQTTDEAVARAFEYANSVLEGSRIVGKWERLFVERHFKDLETGENRGIRFSEERARHVIAFCTRFVNHTKGRWAGKPFVLEGWQAFFLWVLFGWERYNEELDGWYRRFKEAYVSMARKNAKTFLASSIGLYMFAADDEASAEVYSVATKRDQSRECWEQAAAIVRRSPDREFKRAIRTTDSRSNMSILSTGSKFEALGREKDSLDGKSVHLGVADEVHAWTNREPWDVLKSSQGARTSPMMLAITTAGSRRIGICWELDFYGQRVLEDVIEDDTFFPFICRLDEGDQWDDPEVWPKANPNLGVSVSIQKMKDDCKNAHNNPAYQNEYRRKHANEWTEADTAWLAMEAWDTCGTDGEVRKGDHCYMGLDISSTNDMTALVAVFPPNEHRDKYAVRSWFWIPRDTIDKRVHTDRVPVDVWCERGLVISTAGRVIDQDAVKMHLLNLRSHYDIREVAYDPYNGWKLASELDGLGFTVLQFRQGWASMSPAMREAEKLILGGELTHDGNPVLRWQFSNTSVKTDPAGNIKPDKERSADRIDGVVSMIMAVGRASLEAANPPANVAIHWAAG